MGYRDVLNTIHESSEYILFGLHIYFSFTVIF